MCFCLAFSLLLSVSGVNSYAAEVIKYRLADFSLLEGDKPLIFSYRQDGGRDVTLINYSTTSDVKVSAFTKISDSFKFDTSYTLTYSVKVGSVGSSHFILYFSPDPYDLENALILSEIDSSQLSTSYTDFTAQFKIPDEFNGKQCYLVFFLVSSKTGSSIYVSDFVFTNNDKSEEKIDGILEWLSAVYHSIVGGEDNRGVQHDGIVQGIKNGLNGLGDRISSFFTNLWNNISAGFDAIKEKISEIAEGIKLKFEEIADKFTAFFDKFKPRVYEEFLWEEGYLQPDGESVYPVDTFAYTSEKFSNSSGYYVTFNDYELMSLTVFKYESYGDYIDSTTYSSSSEPIYLEPGYKYRLSVRCWYYTTFYNSYEVCEYFNSLVFVYTDEGWVNALLHSLMNILKKLFIPSPGYFESKLDDFLDVYEKHFGIFAQVTIYFVKAIEKVDSILSDKYSFVFPELYITIQGDKYVFLESQSVDIQQWLNSGTWSSDLYEMYRVCASAILVFCVLKYAHKVEGVILGTSETFLNEEL